MAEKRYAMVIDLNRCIGCHACSVACKAEFDVPVGVWRSWVTYGERGTYPDAVLSFLPRLCNHCEDAPCIPVCPTGATYQRDDGVVVIKEERCIGCGYCVEACPYEMRFLHPETKVASKCDFCVHRVDQGLEPACVQTCLGTARIFGDMNDPNSEVSQILKKEKVHQIRPDFGTEPRVFYVDPDPALLDVFKRTAPQEEVV